ncbi:hypothetical protein M0L20_27160 [Spirosoma sp. RP8]|uniref:DUF4258 domain-containing protein n=1 Tax=Spirosoma liriopis TaxID=2937440 RepID=A0ABT0HVM9_9BACT|nr:hypothetical protein [Spirosoma liriopis]MCK8495575.1 hypothetical protein [Spirosoma liriopis]
MQQKSARRKKASKGEWMFALILGAVFLIWFFSSRDNRTPSEKMNNEIDESLREERVATRMSEHRQKRFAELLTDTEQDLNAYHVKYTRVEIAESGCLWVYVPDSNKNRDGLAQSLCSRAKKDFVQCVTIVDPQGNTLGRSLCK